MTEVRAKGILGYVSGAAIGLIAGCLIHTSITLAIDHFSYQVRVPDSPHTKMMILGVKVDDIVGYQLLILPLMTAIGAWLLQRASLKWPRRPLVATALVIAAAVTFSVMVRFQVEMGWKWLWDNYD